MTAYCLCPHHQCLNVNDINERGLCWNCETERLVRMSNEDFVEYLGDVEQRLAEAGMPSLKSIIETLDPSTQA